MVRLALLDAEPVFPDTEYFTVPLPVPVAPEVMLTQDGIFAVVQVQLPEVVTLALPAPPLDAKDALAGETA